MAFGSQIDLIPLCRRPVAADGVKQARAREELFSIVQNGFVWCNIFGFMKLVEIQLGAHGYVSQIKVEASGFCFVSLIRIYSIRALPLSLKHVERIPDSCAKSQTIEQAPRELCDDGQLLLVGLRK